MAGVGDHTVLFRARTTPPDKDVRSSDSLWPNSSDIAVPCQRRGGGPWVRPDQSLVSTRPRATVYKVCYSVKQCYQPMNSIIQALPGVGSTHFDRNTYRRRLFEGRIGKISRRSAWTNRHCLAGVSPSPLNYKR